MALPIKLSTCFFFIINTCFYSVHVYALSGWEKKQQEEFTLYSPHNLSPHQVLYVRSYPLEKHNNTNSKSWFNNKSKAIQSTLGEPSTGWTLKKISTDKYQNIVTFKDISGKKRLASYIGGKLNQDKHYILVLVTSLDKKTTSTYSSQYDDIVKEATSDLLALTSPQSTISTKKEPSKKQQNNKQYPDNKIQLTKAKSPESLIGIWGLLTFGIQAGGIYGSSEDIIAVFDNGDVTTDIAGAFNLGVQQSKKQNPKEWGRWRKKGKTLEIKWSNRNSYEEYDRWWKNKYLKGKQIINGCFSRLSSSSGGAGGIAGITIGQSRTWCFNKDGRFSNNKNSFGNAPGIALSSKTPTLSGRYRIDGHAMTLIYDSGENITMGFAFMSDEKHHISINGIRYLGKK